MARSRLLDIANQVRARGIRTTTPDLSAFRRPGYVDITGIPGDVPFRDVVGLVIDHYVNDHGARIIADQDSGDHRSLAFTQKRECYTPEDYEHVCISREPDRGPEDSYSVNVQVRKPAIRIPRA